MTSTKFWKKTNVLILSQELTKTEEVFVKSLLETEQMSSEYKKDLKNFVIDSVKEVEITCQKT